MSALVSAVLTLLEQILPLLGAGSTATQVASIIQTLVSLLPLVINEIQQVAPAIKNIIAALSANPAATADQLAQLQALDAQVDAAFDQAASDTDAGI